MSEQPRSAFLGDEALAYAGNRRALLPLTFDESYRRCHLPLVAPAHPAVIAEDIARGYAMGWHAELFSLVLPVPGDLLAASPGWSALEAEMRAAPFAGKIAWDLLPRRQDKLHATLCGSLSTGATPAIAGETRAALAAIPPFHVELRGLFAGNINRGRLYLKVHPESLGGANPIHAVQRAFGRAPGDFYLVGLFNLVDELDMADSRALEALIERWWNRVVLQYRVESLDVLGATDDLVLESRVVETINLGRD